MCYWFKTLYKCWKVCPKPEKRLPIPMGLNCIDLNPFKAQQYHYPIVQMWPPSIYMHQIGRKTIQQRPQLWIFRAKYWQMDRDQPFEASSSRLEFFDWLPYFGHSKPIHTPFSPFLDPLNPFPYSICQDFSLFETCINGEFTRQVSLYMHYIVLMFYTMFMITVHICMVILRELWIWELASILHNEHQPSLFGHKVAYYDIIV